MNWTKRNPGWTMFGAMIGLLIFLWGLAIPLSSAPEPIGPAADQFAEGARITVWLTLIAGSAGVVLGVLGGLGKLSKILPIRWLCDFYVWLIRGTPLLLQILFVWLVVPTFMPAGIELSDFTCAAIALSINIGAYNTECVRAGILAVPRGQIEAAIALGLTPRQRLRLIVLPQAMRVIIPPLTSQYLNLTKNSSLGAAIGYPDLVGLFAGTVLNQTGQAIETIAMTMAVYLLISLTISLVMNWYNRRMALVER